MARFTAEILRFGKWMAILGGADVVVGLAWALVRGHPIGTSITGTIFITGGAIFVGSAATGGGGRGRRVDVLAGRAAQPEMPFMGVLIGLALIGVGVLTIVL